MAGLAQAANVSPSTIHDIEKDRRSPAIELVERLALALGVSPSWLAYGEGDGPR
jgi:transcriptional regulator with XRE-family HTH domain